MLNQAFFFFFFKPYDMLQDLLMENLNDNKR